MKIESFIAALNSDFYAGVPDSQLKALCNFLIYKYGEDGKHHIIAANEGNATALAAGYHLATGKTPVVYMQNSGEGNIINPVASLMNDNVYGIPCIFVVGWRGEPGIHDEPQHVFQGKITLRLLEDMDISSFIIDKNTTEEELVEAMNEFRPLLSLGKQVAFVIRKGALLFDEKVEYSNVNSMKREEIIRHIIDATGDDPVVSTTGKASRELFEIRESRGQGHGLDFLTVGSMGHTSSIALGIALQRPDKRIWVIDGDGSCLMHMGALAVIGAAKVENLVHIVINNGAHETVGGQPTAAGKVSLQKIAQNCGYFHSYQCHDFNELDYTLEKVRANTGLTFIEVMCSIGARENLGRPTTSAKENKVAFMESLKNTRIPR